MVKKVKSVPGGPKGFAAMSPAQRRVCGSLGGRLSHLSDTPAHEWSAREAKAAGKIGGKQTASLHDMKEIGKLGGRPKGYSPKSKTTPSVQPPEQPPTAPAPKTEQPRTEFWDALFGRDDNK